MREWEEQPKWIWKNAKLKRGAVADDALRAQSGGAHGVFWRARQNVGADFEREERRTDRALEVRVDELKVFQTVLRVFEDGEADMN